MRDFIKTLAEAGVELTLDGSRLTLRSYRSGAEAPFLEQVRARRAELVAYLSDGAAAQAPHTPLAAIPSVARGPRTRLPLSFAQQRLWFLDRLGGGSAHYNMPSAVRVRGRFDPALAERALGHVVARHEVLRTVFAADGGDTWQVVRRDAAFALARTDLSALAPAAREAALRALIDSDAATPFNLARDLMLRARYVHCAEGDGVLLLNVHHIASDGWSAGLLVAEFINHYDALTAGRAPGGAPLALQYADYAHWQRAALVGPSLASQLAYWETQLAGLPPLHGVPLDHPRPVEPLRQGARQRRFVGAATLAGLKALARKEQATLFMVLHAALSVLLARYGSSDDVVIGTPVANRSHPALQPLIGFFANTLVLRTDCAGDPTFSAFLQTVRSIDLAAQANQDVPFDVLVERLNPVRSLHSSPLFQIMFSLEDAGAPLPALPGLDFAPIAAERVPAKFELTFSASEQDGQLALVIDVDRALFEPATAERLGAALATLLDAIVAAPETPIRALPLLDAGQLAQLAALNATDADFPDRACLHELFEVQAARTPQRIALVTGAAQLDYAELNARANRLAHHLRAEGVGPDRVVGLCTGRGPAMLVGLLAILKAGGAYLPLDPDYPAERLALMVEDSGIALVLSEQGLAPATAAMLAAGVSVLALDAPQCLAALARYDSANLARPAGLSSRHLAYVIYTSGSTGRPKGVMVEHRSAANLAAWQQRRLGVGETSRVLGFSSLSFDAATFEWLWALLGGAALHVCAAHERSDPRALETYLLAHRITHALLPPAMLAHLERDLPFAFEHLIVGGEACPPALAQHWLQKVRLFNAYGPTESTVCSNVVELEAGQPVTIGGPIQNTQLYVLDPGQRPVPPGAAGELYIGGAGLARGYLQRPDLTAERFVLRDGARLYRTGDLVRYLADGKLAYLGRSDSQVKIRGFRIEPAEIEARLRRNPAVREAALRVDGDGETLRLIAYVGAPGAGPELAGILRADLANGLPHYMVPAQLIVLDSLPLSANGKLDAGALPAPDSVLPASHLAPRSTGERVLAGLWGELLQLPPEQIGCNDNFFSLGGHSLLAARLAAGVRRVLGVELAIKDVFGAQNLAELATLVDAATPAQRPALTAHARPARLPLSFAQQRLWFLDRFDGGSAHYNIALALHVDGRFDIGLATRAFERIVVRHETLRTVFDGAADDAWQVVNPPGPFTIREVDLRALAPQQRAVAALQHVRADAATGFDLVRDPMLRATYLHCDADSGVLLLNVHHIAADGWSMQVLMREFVRHYEAPADGQADPLPPLPIQYADYALWQRSWLTGAPLERQLAYWTKQLANLPQIHGLALDRPRPPRQKFIGARHAFHIGPQLTEALARLAQEHGATWFMLLHAALGMLLARHGGNADVVIGTPVANRPEPELEPLIGFFVNTLVLRTAADPGERFDRYLAQVKAVNLDAQAHQDLPFELLVERLQPQRSTAHSPLFQIVLNWAMDGAAPDHTGLMRSVRFTPLDDGAVSAKYELAFNAALDSDGLALSIDYNVGLFNAATVARLATNFGIVLQAIAADPDLTLGAPLDGFVAPAPAPPEPPTAAPARPYALPQGAHEETMARIWCELLGLERVGRHDHFFERGGHSLLALRLAVHVRQALGASVALRDLFAFPTLEGMARVAAQAIRQDAAPIVAVGRTAPLALSWPQQRLWFLDQLDPGASLAYHIPLGLRLQGALDPDVLQRALDRLLVRHESLRTRFVSHGGEPVLEFAAAGTPFALGRRDLSHLDRHEQAAALEGHAVDEVNRAFDLAAGPPIRGLLLRLGEDDHLLLITQHHIVTDGWSMGILVRELGALYGAFAAGLPDPLAPLAIGYADYAAWQRNWLQGEVLQQQLAFWRQHLRGAPDLLELPTDRPRPPTQSHAGASVPFALDRETERGLRSLCQRQGATLFMGLLGALAVLLGRLSGQDDLVIAIPVANRQRKEVEPLIGLFVNTLPLRIRLDGDISAAALLDQIRATTLDAYVHQDLPFEQMVEALQPARSMRHNPVFQVMLAFNNIARQDVALPGLSLSAMALPQTTSQVDLTVSLDESADGITGSLVYASDLFDHATVQAWAGHLQTLVAALVAAPQQPVGNLPILTQSQRHRILEQFNDTARAYPRELLTHTLFEEQARRRPDAPAVECDGRAIAYGELNARANQIAHHLVGLGVRPNARVAICLGRSIEMVVCLLGILKAGGTYVPLDPDYPTERLAWMLADSAPVVLLTETALAGRLAFDGALLCVDSAAARQQIAGQPTVDPDARALGLVSTDLAYVIYTSGSTGQPKGVAVQHRPVVNLFDWVTRRFAVGSADKLLFTTSLCFDLSVYDVFGTLAAGAVLRVATQAETGDPRRLLDIIVAEGITFWDSAPAVFNALVPYLPGVPGQSRLRLAFFSGDRIALELPGALRRAFPECEVIALGGATEATVWSNYYPVGALDPAWTSIPYGKPIQNARYYVLDRYKQPCPIGVAGDLYIGGECLSSGYFRRETLTAERYPADPFRDDAQARMYQTGDRARYRNDGNLEFLGRSDFQVKLRGFRIELGEIEACLVACAGVRDATVIAREDVPGDQRLVAYLLAQGDAAPDVAALRAALQQALPRYMVPSAFVLLDAFPLTANGKLDRKALPAPVTEVADHDDAPPPTPTEQWLAEIWAEALGLERVGIHDDFFELGGHSMLAVQSVDKIRARTAAAVSLQLFFEAPTVAQFAQALDRADAASTSVQPAGKPARKSRLVWD